MSEEEFIQDIDKMTLKIDNENGIVITEEFVDIKSPDLYVNGNKIENGIQLLEQCEKLTEENKQLNDIRNKAIEYIKHSYWLRLDQVYDTSKDLKGWEVEQLLEILRGKDEN